MTGVGDILYAMRRTVRRSPTISAFLSLADFLLELFPMWWATWLRRMFFPAWWEDELGASSVRWPLQFRPDCRATMDLMKKSSQKKKKQQQFVVGRSEKHRWGLLLPITSRGSDDIWARLEVTLRKLVVSIPDCHRPQTRVHIGIDQNDPALDSSEARRRMRQLLSPLAVEFAAPFVPAFQGKICWMWAEMAAQAVAAGADFFVLLGDDVELHDATWQIDVEEQFFSIASSRRVPFGCGCVAIQDTSFPCFPTFPVLHRFHLEVFDGKLFPPEFVNQHGDPFLFELYRRWGAARFTARSSLTNTIGGFGDARYRKAGGVHWKGSILTRAIDSLFAN